MDCIICQKELPEATSESIFVSVLSPWWAENGVSLNVSGSPYAHPDCIKNPVGLDLIELARRTRTARLVAVGPGVGRTVIVLA